jgi:hypothetical protein
VNDIEKSAKIFAMTLYNYEQEQLFKSGKIAMPKANSLEEYDAIIHFMKNFKASEVPFYNVDLKNDTLIFDLPTRYKNE